MLTARHLQEKQKGFNQISEYERLFQAQHASFAVDCHNGCKVRSTWQLACMLTGILVYVFAVKEPSMSAKRLATEALTRGSADNITVIVAFLQPVSTLEQIYANGRQKYAPHQMFVNPNRSVKPSYIQSASADEFRDTY
jgi:hypothetical protein